MTINLSIAVEKVAYIIQLARQFEVKVAPTHDEYDPGPAEEEADDILEARRSDPVFEELVELFDDLNVDEALDVVLLTWIGRGTYGKDQWDEARQTAQREATHSTAEYLLGTPLLPEYLAEGLAELGYSSE